MMLPKMIQILCKEYQSRTPTYFCPKTGTRDPVTRTQYVHDLRCDNPVFAYDPWSGVARNLSDIRYDPQGFLIDPQETLEPLRAEQKNSGEHQTAGFNSQLHGGMSSTYTDDRSNHSAANQNIGVATNQGVLLTALGAQVGGAHYKNKPIQPIEYCHANKLGPCESAVVKYVTRWCEKNGLEDLKKAIHYLQLLIELESKSTESTSHHQPT